RLPGTWDGFELAVRAILSDTELQQANVNQPLAALVSACGQRLVARRSGEPDYLFPSPSALRKLAPASTRYHVSPDAAQRIRRLSDAVLAGAIRFDPTSTFPQLVHRLVEIAGLGEHRAAWVAMRTLGEPDAPVVEGSPFALSRTPNETSVSWRPWRSYV